MQQLGLRGESQLLMEPQMLIDLFIDFFGESRHGDDRENRRGNHSS
jgi:hypothetical protein